MNILTLLGAVFAAVYVGVILPAIFGKGKTAVRAERILAMLLKAVNCRSR